MSSLDYSHHARARMQQRGLRKRDVELIVDFGTRVSEEAYILRRQDATHCGLHLFGNVVLAQL